LHKLDLDDKGWIVFLLFTLYPWSRGLGRAHHASRCWNLMSVQSVLPNNTPLGDNMGLYWSTPGRMGDVFRYINHSKSGSYICIKFRFMRHANIICTIYKHKYEHEHHKSMFTVYWCQCPSKNVDSNIINKLIHFLMHVYCTFIPQVYKASHHCIFFKVRKTTWLIYFWNYFQRINANCALNEKFTSG
jgi:hypothetical protein